MDDIRPGPMVQFDPSMKSFGEIPDKNWVVVRSIEVIKTLLEADLVQDLDLDHDMGEDPETGYTLCKWMEENNIWPKGIIHVHTLNPDGGTYMRALLTRNRR
jgi:hypothetical protein